MRPLLIIVCILSIVIIAQASSYKEDRFATDVSVRKLSTVSSSFTDITGYNTWDHARIPLGIFEKQKAVTTLNFGYRRVKFTDINNMDSTRIFNGILAPYIRVGQPGVVFLDMFYTINPTEINDDGEYPNMPLHRFGLSIMGQIEDGRFQVGICGQGYYGREEWSENGNKRILMGGDEVGLFIGFKLHEAVLLNVFGHAAGYVDTLFLEEDQELPQERFSWLQLPEINIALDIGMDDLPYRANMSYTYSHNNFVYTQKPFIFNIENTQHPITEYNEGADADPIVSDSIAWHMQHLWNIRINDILRFDPAVQLGYWHSRYKHMKPNGDNYPINYDGDQSGYEWDTKSFRFGIGSSWWMKEITTIWLEYSFNTLTLDVTGDKLSAYKDEVPDTKGYSRFGVGFTTNFNEIPALGMPDAAGLYFTFGFLFMKDNDLTSPYRSQAFKHMYPMFNNSASDLNVELNRYRPWEVIKNQLTTTNISFCIGATFLDNAFETALHFGILRQQYTAGRDEEYKGFEFGLDLIYNKFGSLKSSSEKQVDKTEAPAPADTTKPAEDTETPYEQPDQQY